MREEGASSSLNCLEEQYFDQNLLLLHSPALVSC